MAQHDLFVRLSRYRPREGRDSLEDFFTELVAHCLQTEPAMLERLLSLLGIDARGSSYSVSTQVPTVSSRARLDGLRVDLLLRRSDGYTIIIENKVDAQLGEDQLEKYLDYAKEQTRPDAPWVVAVVSKGAVGPLVSSPQFLKQIRWATVAEEWRQLRTVTNRCLLDQVLAFMEANEMTPVEPFELGEVGAYFRWRSLEAKVGRILAEAEEKILPGISGLPEVGVLRDMTSYGWCIGKGWSAPQEHASIWKRDFWVFFGLPFVESRSWFAPLVEQEHELAIFVGMWDVNLRSLRQHVDARCDALVRAGFHITESRRGRDLFLVRRTGLGELVKYGNSSLRAREFILEAHHALTTGTTLLELYQAFKRTGASLKGEGPNDEKGPGEEG